MRVYELSKQLGIPTKDLLRRLSAVGIEVASHMTQLSEDDIKKVLNPGKVDRRGGRPSPSGRPSPARPHNRPYDKTAGNARPPRTSSGGPHNKSAGASEGGQGGGASSRPAGAHRSAYDAQRPRTDNKPGGARPARPGGSAGRPGHAGSELIVPDSAAAGVRSGRSNNRHYDKSPRAAKDRGEHEVHLLEELESSSRLGGRGNSRKMNMRDEPAPDIVYAPLVVAPMSVAEFCQRTGKPLHDVIVYLLKKGIAAPKTTVVSQEVVADLVAHFEVPTQKPELTSSSAQAVELVKKQATGQRRPPVVVVVGHVDHGKTTLLDKIRQARVAEKEKGGITQHLGAYQVLVDGSTITMLDTPGHEAFSLIRVRGITVADIAILVVAADDGVMPQTIEAIKRLQDAQIPTIVALNKIDKASPAQIEAAKRGLSQYGIVPEEWGGPVPLVPISAKMGTGITTLLELVVLQAQMLDLFADMDKPAQGVVLESKMERGRGAVATVICHQGILHLGDYFVTQNASGKVSALIDEQGRSIKQATPSMPVQVAGFDELAQVGSLFDVVSARQAREHRSSPQAAASQNKFTPLGMSVIPHQGQASLEPITLVIRADNMSSKEAILNAITAISLKSYRPFQVVFSGIGLITENDIEFASQAGALIYGFHVKIDKDAQIKAHRLGIKIVLHDIIYKMLEELQELAEKDRPVKKVWKKMGEAVVLKVFDIKGIGVVAGARVLSGKLLREGKLVVQRGKYQVGQGMIISLQKERKNVKEVATGHECAFMIQNFDGWLVDDHVDCLVEVPE